MGNAEQENFPAPFLFSVRGSVRLFSGNWKGSFLYCLADMRMGLLTAGLILASSAWADAGADRKVGLGELLDRVAASSVELAMLKGDLEVSRSEVDLAMPRRNPELRFQYNHQSAAEVPDPYTEQITETITEKGSTSSRGSSSESETETYSGVSGGTARSGESSTRSGSSFRDNSRYDEQVTRTTTREIIPGRNIEVVRETTTETRYFNGNSTRKTSTGTSEEGIRRESGSPDELYSTSASSSSRDKDKEAGTTRVLRESVEETVYGRDPYAGSDEYSVELRFYPRNPWELKARTRRALASVSLNEFLYRAAESRVRMAAKRAFIELQLLHAEQQCRERLAEISRERLALSRELGESGRMTPEDVHLQELKLLDQELDLEETAGLFDRAYAALASQAGLEHGEELAFEDAYVPPQVSLDGLDPDALLELALSHNERLGQVILQIDMAGEEVSISRAGRMPWLSVVSATYEYEERYNDKVRDAYSFFAGIELPVFEWISGTSSKPFLARMEALARQRALLEMQLQHQIRLSSVDLEEALADLESFLKRESAAQEAFTRRLEGLEPDTLTQKEAQLVVRRLQEEWKLRRGAVFRRYTERLMSFLSLIGTDLDDLFESGMPGSPS